jgi:hypothetical protein
MFKLLPLEATIITSIIRSVALPPPPIASTWRRCTPFASRTIMRRKSNTGLPT